MLSVNSLANFVALPVRGSSQLRQAVSALQTSLLLTAINRRFTHHTLLVALYRSQCCLGQFDV